MPDKNKNSKIEITRNEDEAATKNLIEIIKETKDELLIFSGNLSFINFSTKNHSLFAEIENLVKKQVKIKILCRVDLVSMKNVEKLLSLNFKHGKNIIEVRHREQPLRATISDKKVIQMKEVKEPTGKINELDKTIFMFYNIKDKDWADWMSKIFWKMFSESIGAEKRIEELRKLK